MSPVIARSFFRTQERLLGRPTFRLLGELEHSDAWPRERLEAMQLARLRDLLGAAYVHTPYWREVMDHAGVRPETLASPADLPRLPLLEKETIRTRREEMAWRGAARRTWRGRTGGSTATPIEFYTSALREAHISAARIRGHNWLGMQKGEREMYFWGSPVEITKQDTLKSARDRLIGDGFTDGFHLSERDVPRLVDAWRRFRPKCIFCYPSSMVFVVRTARRRGVDLTGLKRCGLAMVVTTAEILGPAREEIAGALGVPVYDSYGLREVGLVGHECRHQTMHATEEQFILETIDPATLEPAEGEGELVVTSLISHPMPMIRYRTGDLVTLDPTPCPCGRTLRGVRLSGGRAVDFLVTSTGMWLSGGAFVWLLRDVPGLLKLQAQQERIGHIRLLVVPGEDFHPAGEQMLREGLRKWLRCDDQIEICEVADIPACPSGKHRLVVSRVAEQMRREKRAG